MRYLSIILIYLRYSLIHCSNASFQADNGFYRKPDFKIPNTGNLQSSNLKPFTRQELLKLAIREVVNVTRTPISDLKVTDQIYTSKLLTVYITKMINGLIVNNNDASVTVSSYGQVISVTTNFYKSSTGRLNKRATNKTITLEEAEAIACKRYNVPRDGHPASRIYFEISDGKFVYAYKFQLRDILRWFQVIIDSNTGATLSVDDYYRDVAFNAITLPGMDISNGLTLYKADKPNMYGWFNDTPAMTYGNNAHVMLDSKSYNPKWKTDAIGYSIASENGDIFSSKYDKNEPSHTINNQKVSVLNALYIVNMMHDISYQYGFIESAGNFQYRNRIKLGLDEDELVVVVQSKLENGRTKIAVPPDGQRPLMRLGFHDSKNQVDIALDNTVIIHEYGHGISNRLTGGPSKNCLKNHESQGLGEGWSDAFAFMFTMAKEDSVTKNVAIGAYASSRVDGARNYLYSMDKKVNPLTYRSLVGLKIHKIGEVWATILYSVYWELVISTKFCPNWLDYQPDCGNHALLKIILTGMQMQSCNPDFIEAREQMLAADGILYDFKYKCPLWIGFAYRGLGADAKPGKRDFTIPRECYFWKNRNRKNYLKWYVANPLARSDGVISD